MLLPYPPRTFTSHPIKNTTVAVTSLPALKQNPVAVARMVAGNTFDM